MKGKSVFSAWSGVARSPVGVTDPKRISCRLSFGIQPSPYWVERKLPGRILQAQTRSCFRRVSFWADQHESHTISAAGLERARSEEHTSELQSLAYLVCRLLLE